MTSWSSISSRKIGPHLPIAEAWSNTQGLPLERRLFELDVLAQVEEGAGACRLDPLVDSLGDGVDDVSVAGLALVVPSGGASLSKAAAYAIIGGCAADATSHVHRAA